MAENVTVKADPTLLSIVLHNLLSNAWKYTSRGEESLIEFGVTKTDGEELRFVSGTTGQALTTRRQGASSRRFTAFTAIRSSREPASVRQR